MTKMMLGKRYSSKQAFEMGVVSGLYMNQEELSNKCMEFARKYAHLG